MTVQLIPVASIPDVETGDDLAGLIIEAVASAGQRLDHRDVVVVTHKIVSKAEGAVAGGIVDDAAYRRLVETEAVSILRRRGDLVIAETRHGFICANAGVDRSNTTGNTAVLLPEDPDRSAHRLRMSLQRISGVDLGVVITDTFGRAWRRGVVDVAIGISGVPAVVDHRGSPDMYGRIMESTEVGLADEIAAAADLVMGKASGVPVAIVRGLAWTAPAGRGRDLVRHPDEDLFR